MLAPVTVPTSTVANWEMCHTYKIVRFICSPPDEEAACFWDLALQVQPVEAIRDLICLLIVPLLFFSSSVSVSFVRNFQTVCFILKNKVASYTYDVRKQQHCLFFLDEGSQVRVTYQGLCMQPGPCFLGSLLGTL